LKRALARTFLGLIALIVLCVVALAASIYIYGLHTDDVPADAAVVLGAAAWGPLPSPVFRERINHAVDLYRRGRVHKLVFTGGTPVDWQPAEGQVARDYAVAAGVSPADILLETTSRVTEQNLANAKAIIDAAGIRTVLIVSDPLHMKRAMLMARDLGYNAYSSPTPTSRYVSVGNQMSFLVRETFYYAGYLVYRLL
jgi:uncharacterized SAM-binding protein YcdF (DUF218 family)